MNCKEKLIKRKTKCEKNELRGEKKISEKVREKHGGGKMN